MLDVLFLITFIVLAGIGLKVPLVAFIGYVWIDVVTPQNISYGFMIGKPLSMLMALVCIASMVFNAKKLRAPSSKFLWFLMFLWAGWITVTTMNSLFPLVAWDKWDWAFKTVMFSALIPLVLRTRRHVEVFFLAFVIAIAYFTLSAGVKSVFGGGGYGARVVFGGGNSGTSESSTLAALAVMTLPWLFHFYRFDKTFEKVPFRKYLWIGLGVAALMTVIGTEARTGLIAIAVFLMVHFMKSQRKFRYVLGVLIVAPILFYSAPESWHQRMGTISGYEQDSSAEGRVVVWKWTWDFVKDHPFGGGFGAFIANAGQLHSYIDNEVISSEISSGAKAFHSVYFEVLGEHGYVGILIFLGIALLVLKKLGRYLALSKGEGIEQQHNYSLVLAQRTAFLIFLVSGAFIGIAFQPFFYYLVATTLAIEKVVIDDAQSSV